ncbi:hypothetical protein ABVT39_003985 [Epinephelus coioides]
MAGYGFDIDVIDTLLKPSVITHPYISLPFSRLSLSKLPAALPREQLGVSECGWSGRGGRERARDGERKRISPALMFPKKRRGGRGGREKERVSEKQRESKAENKLWDYICPPDVASTVV